MCPPEDEDHPSAEPAVGSWQDFFAEPGLDLGPRDQPPAQERGRFEAAEGR